MTQALITVASPALLTVCVVLLALRAQLKDQARAFLILKPLATLFIMLYAFAGLESLFDKRGLLVVAALGFSVIGDALLVFPKRFVLGLLCFAFAHLAYAVSFFAGVSTQGLLFFALPLAFIMLLVTILLWRDSVFPKMGLLFYLFSLSLMVYQAGERSLSLPALIPNLLQAEAGQLSAFVALAGAITFLFSAIAFLFGKSRKLFSGTTVWVLPMYYLAQWLIAFSVHIRFR